MNNSSGDDHFKSTCLIKLDKNDNDSLDSGHELNIDDLGSHEDLQGTHKPNWKKRFYRKWARSAVSKFCGTQPQNKERLDHCVVYDVIDSLLRGIGQIYFADNPITGLFIIGAVLLYSPFQGLTMMLGCVTSTLTAYCLGVNRELIRHGLFGYNGALVGSALPLFNSREKDGLIIVASLVLPTFTTLISIAISKLITVSYGIPVLTFPFQVTLWIWLLGCQNYNYFPVNETMLQPGLNVNPSTNHIVGLKISGSDFYNGIFKGIAQVSFADSVISGFIILVGLVINSPLISLATLLGSIIGVCTGLSLGVSIATVKMGLFSFNPCLTFMAIFYFTIPKDVRLIPLALWATVFSGIISGGVSSFFSPVGIPALTFPFTFVTWLILFSADLIPWLKQVPLAQASVIEGHIINYKRGDFEIEDTGGNPRGEDDKKAQGGVLRFKDNIDGVDTEGESIIEKEFKSEFETVKLSKGTPQAHVRFQVSPSSSKKAHDSRV